VSARAPHVAIVGGGPGGLYLARLLRLSEPRARVTVYERNTPDATFGFGVVFSERTLSGFRRADTETHARIVAACRQWSHMELRYAGAVRRYGGFGFSAIARTTLLRILQEGAAGAGAELRFEQEVGLDDVAGADVVVAADGVGSAIRAELAAELGFAERAGRAKYAWFGTTAPFEVVTFPFARTEHGLFAAHAYPYDDTTATFVAEVDEDAWRRAGMDRSTAAAETPGASDLESKAYLEAAFAEHLAGEPLLVNNSKWASFRVIHNDRWHHGNVVLLGDAAHTAHFSVGSGTKMAMEDSIALARALAAHDDVAEAFAAYERERRPGVERTQRWAEPSQRWWESFGRRRPADPSQFAFHFITRTGAMTYAGLCRRDASAVADAERVFRHDATGGNGRPAARLHALAAPLALAGRTLRNRLLAPARDAHAAAGLALAGAGAVLVPLPVEPEPAAAAAALARRIAAAGALPAARLADADPARVEGAAAAGFELVVAPVEPGGDVAALVATAGGALPALAWEIPAVDAWSDAGETFVAHAQAAADAGVRLLLLSAAAAREEAGRLGRGLAGLALADRVRTEAGVPVALAVPSGWGLHPPADGQADDCSTALHVALVAGRIDLVASWPLAAPLHDGDAGGGLALTAPAPAAVIS